MQVKIRKYKSSDAKEVGKLIGKTYTTCNSGEGSKKAVQAFIGRFDPSKVEEGKLRERLSRSEIAFVATHNGKIIGVVRGSHNYLVNWFVLPKYHGKGVGKKLIERYEREAFKKSKQIKVRASLFAQKAYAKRGYKKTTGQRNFHGLKVQPMRKRK